MKINLWLTANDQQPRGTPLIAVFIFALALLLAVLISELAERRSCPPPSCSWRWASSPAPAC